MSAPSPWVIRRGAEQARCSPWRGDGKLAHLAPTSDSQPLSASFVRHCAGRLGREGFSGIVTSALAPVEQTGFLEAGFEIEQRLHLLVHDLAGLDSVARPEGVKVRRARRSDMDGVVLLDGQAFDDFWSMDAAAIREAVEATPRARFRLAVHDGAGSEHRRAESDEATGGQGAAGGGIVGYAITGRAGTRGYLQRLAVAERLRGQGLGRHLVGDGLRWLRRWGADQCMVNTQEGNDRALDLYERMGFRREPAGLAVLASRLAP